MVTPYILFCLSVLHLIVAKHANNPTDFHTNEAHKHKISLRNVAAQSVDIKEFLESNLVQNNVPSQSRRKRQQLNNANFDREVDKLRTAIRNNNQPYRNYPNMKQYDTQSYPYKEIIQQIFTDRIGNQLYVTKYLKADIRSTHISKRHSHEQPRKHIKDYLELVGFKNGLEKNDPNADQVGHLLALSLGGTNDDQFNFAPQTARLNTQTENSHSLWFGEERAMNKFLQTPNRRIEWELLVSYPPLTTTGLYRYRPTRFYLRHRNFNEHNMLVDNYNNAINLPGPVMCFGNDAQDECRYEHYY